MALVERLVRVDPKCGETAVHKASFIGQVLLGLPFHLEWRLHKHGPWSPDLLPELERSHESGCLQITKRANGHLRFAVPGDDSRPTFSPETGKKLDLLAGRFAPMRLSQLEIAATAAWATRFSGDQSIESRAAYMVKLKPHIDAATARRALEYLDSFLREVSNLKRPSPASHETERDHQQGSPPAFSFTGGTVNISVGGRDINHTSAMHIDANALIMELRRLGVGSDERTDLIEAVRADRSSLIHEWMERLRTGAIQLGSGVTIATATDALVKLLNAR
jgi:hypothetical protein